jgi:iron-sulfur cluster assembly accessory protein
MTIAMPIDVTEAALRRIGEISEAEGAPKLLRVAVLGGGCSGFQYEFALEDAPAPEDVVLGDGRVVVDPESLPFLSGSRIDFRDELIGARFAIDNPNATSSCGCGTSFSM